MMDENGIVIDEIQFKNDDEGILYLLHLAEKHVPAMAVLESTENMWIKLPDVDRCILDITLKHMIGISK